MGLYAIGDLHLHYQAECKATNQLTDRLWRDHERKLKKHCDRMLGPEDTLVLVGDHSWGRKLSECGQDLDYIAALPGRKILTRGNHDMFWEANKTPALNERYAGTLSFLQGNYFTYRDYALVGSKGFCFEGPFYLNQYRQIVGWDEEAEEHAKKVVERELGRLRASFELAKADGYRKFIVFLHYPPTSLLERESGFTRMAEEYGAEKLIYAHCHGQNRFYLSLMGAHNGVDYQLVAGDYLRWKPYRILD